MSDKVVLAYSGGLDTSVAVQWLKENYNLDVIALTIDVGNERDFSVVKQKALKVGAVKSLVKDAKELFVSYFIFPALQADALYEGQYPLATALSRPLMAKKTPGFGDRGLLYLKPLSVLSASSFSGAGQGRQCR